MDIKERVKQYENDIVRDICQQVRIKSLEESAIPGAPFGKGCALALETALKQAQALGFKTVNLDNYCGYAEVGEGEDIIGVLTHVDIVPEGQGWDYEPYGAQVVDGKIYGRGSGDNKGPGVMAMYALKVLVDMGVKFNKRVRLVFGANEETGFECVKHYLEKEGDFTMGFSPDAEFPLIFGEKGIAQLELKGVAKDTDDIKILSIKGGEAANVVPPLASAVLTGGDLTAAREVFETYLKEKGLEGNWKLEADELTLEMKGVSGHASTPHKGKNAISYLFDALRLITPGNTLVKAYNENISLSYLGENCAAACEDEYGPLTFNAGLIDYNKGEFTLTIDIRYPITKKFEPILENIKKAFEGTGFEIIVLVDKKPLYVDPESDLVKALYGVYTEVTGDTKHKPFTIGGGTYSRAFKNVVAFGAVLPDIDEENAHMKNEHIKISSALLSTEIFAKAILKLLEI